MPYKALSEHKTRDDRTKLFPKGLGRHLTAVEFCDELREQHREKEAKAAEKAKRKTTRVAKKVTKDVAKVEWERMLAEHKDAVARWEAQCVTLRGENVRVKDLPPKPKRPRKPKLASGGDVDVDKLSDSLEDDEGG